MHPKITKTVSLIRISPLLCMGGVGVQEFSRFT
jgi:hypothetical protein